MSDPEPTAAEQAAYIARMLAGLEQIADEGKFGMLAYLLAIAREEAEARKRDGEDAR